MKKLRRLQYSGSAKSITSANYGNRLQSARSLISLSSITKNQNTNDYSNYTINNILSSNSELPAKENFNDYSMHINESLAKYHGIDQDKLFKDKEQLPIIQMKEPFIPKREKEKIRKILKLNRSNRSLGYGEKKETGIRININEDYRDKKFDYSSQVYASPFQSLRVLRQNHQIYDEINKSFLERQMQCLDESIEAVESMTMKYKVKMPKIRITQMIAKGFYDDPSKSKTNVTNNNEEIEEEDEDEEPKKKKQKQFEGITIKKPIQDSKLYAFFKYPNKNFPEGREQFSISLYNNKVILFGGMSSTIKSTVIWSLDLESLEWTMINAKTLVHYLRYGHTSVCIGSKLFIYGGRTKFINSTEFADHDMFNLDTNTWITPTFQTKKKPTTRRNHIGEVIGNQYLIQGGMSFDGEALNDTYLLNLNPLKWIPASVSRYTPGPFLYGHASSLVIPFEIRFSGRFSVYKYPENRTHSILYEKGLYIYGGKTKDDKISSELYLLIIGKSTLEWKIIETQGKRPPPRYFHSMNFYEKGNFLIVHGGRNDYKSDSYALNDTYIFSLTKLEWREVILHSDSPDFKVLTRCGHAGVIYANKLVIFGGMNANNYLGSSLFVVNLNFEYEHSTKTIEEVMRKRLLNNYAMVKEDKSMLKKFQYLMSKNQLEIMPDYTLPNIK